MPPGSCGGSARLRRVVVLQLLAGADHGREQAEDDQQHQHLNDHGEKRLPQQGAQCMIKQLDHCGQPVIYLNQIEYLP